MWSVAVNALYYCLLTISHGRTGDLEGAVTFYRSVLEHSGNIYANSFIAVLLAYAQKVEAYTLEFIPVLWIQNIKFGS